MAGAIAFAGTTEVVEGAGDAVLPSGYRPYEAEELEAVGLVDVGPLFQMEDGSQPVLGTEPLANSQQPTDWHGGAPQRGMKIAGAWRIEGGCLTGR